MRNIRSLVEEINFRDQERIAETFRFMEEQKIRKALAPNLWEGLKKEIFGQCDAIVRSSSVRIECEEDGINRLLVTNPNSGATASLELNPEVPCVFYRSATQKGQLMTRVSPDGSAIQWIWNGVPKSDTDIALGIIREVL